jgi:hypothetical protein
VKRNRGMISMTLTLAAGVSQRIGVSGDYFHALTAPVNDLQVRFDEGKATPIYEGVGFRVYYDALELSSATGQTVTVLVGFGSVFDGRATANVNVTATVAAGNTFYNGGDVALTSGAAGVLLAADATRTLAVVTNPSTNTVTIRVGPAAVDATHGIPVEPGETAFIPTTAAVYGYQASGGPVTVSAASIQQV